MLFADHCPSTQVGSNEGTGLLNLGLDWQYITSTCMSLPLKQQVNSWVGLAIFWIAMPAVYYTNAWSAKTILS